MDKQHGEYSLDWQGPVLVLRAHGSWNDVAVRNLLRDIARARTKRPLQRWALLSDAREWEGGTPDVLDRWNHGIQQAAGSHLVAFCQVVPAGILHRVLADMSAEQMGISRFRFATTLEEGFTWLATQLSEA